MENRLAQQYSDFLNSTVLRPLAEFVKSQPDEVGAKDIDGLIQRFQSVLQLPQSSVPSVQHHAPQMMNNGINYGQGMQNHLPSNMHPHSNFSPPMVNIPGLGSGLGGPAPPKPAAGKPSAGRGRGKTNKVEPLWYSVEQFTAAIQQGQQLCAYCPPRGGHKDSVCAAPAVNAETQPDYKLWRCATDASKQGQIEKKLNTPIVGVVPSSFPGFNAPMGGSAPPPMGGTGVQTRAQAASSRPPLPNFPNIPSGIPGLPTFSSGGLPSFPSLPNGAGTFAGPGPQAPRETSQPADLDVEASEGLKDGHYLTSHPKTSKWLVNNGDKMVILGKFNHPVTEGHTFRPDYEQDLIPLTVEEQNFAINVLGVPYENPNHASGASSPPGSNPVSPVDRTPGTNPDPRRATRTRWTSRVAEPAGHPLTVRSTRTRLRPTPYTRPPRVSFTTHEPTTVNVSNSDRCIESELV